MARFNMTGRCREAWADARPYAAANRSSIGDGNCPTHCGSLRLIASALEDSRASPSFRWHISHRSKFINTKFSYN